MRSVRFVFVFVIAMGFASSGTAAIYVAPRPIYIQPAQPYQGPYMLYARPYWLGNVLFGPIMVPVQQAQQQMAPQAQQQFQGPVQPLPIPGQR